MSENDNKNAGMQHQMDVGPQDAVASWLVPLALASYLPMAGWTLFTVHNLDGDVRVVNQQLTNQHERNARTDERDAELERRVSELDSRCDRGEITLGQLRILCTTAANPSGAGAEWDVWPPIN